MGKVYVLIAPIIREPKVVENFAEVIIAIQIKSLS